MQIDVTRSISVNRFHETRFIDATVPQPYVFLYLLFLWWIERTKQRIKCTFGTPSANFASFHAKVRTVTPPPPLPPPASVVPLHCLMMGESREFPTHEETERERKKASFVAIDQR